MSSAIALIVTLACVVLVDIPRVLDQWREAPFEDLRARGRVHKDKPRVIVSDRCPRCGYVFEDTRP